MGTTVLAAALATGALATSAGATATGAGAVATGAGAVAMGAGGTVAQSAPWRLASSFGSKGVASLPVRERLTEASSQGAPPLPERYRSLLVPGPDGSVFVGGYARGKAGAFLIARVSGSGKLVKSFGHDGVMTVPAIAWFRRDPPRMLVLAGGRLLIVGLDRADRFVAVRLTARGAPDRAFGHNGVVQYKLAHAHRFTIVTAAVVEPDGDILAVYQKELPQPFNQPRVPEGQGNGVAEYVRLLPSGALDRSFGKSGFLAAGPREFSLLEGESGTVGACAETLVADGSLLIAYESSALEEFDLAGVVVAGFARNLTLPAVSPPTYETSNDYHFCDGLFALPGGAIEGVAGRKVARLTPTGTLDPTFGKSGSTTIDAPVEAAAVAPDGETFSAGQSGRALVVSGILANGLPDPALGGARGRRFAVGLRGPTGLAEEEKPTWEVLPVAHSLTIRVGEKLIRIGEQ